MRLVHLSNSAVMQEAWTEALDYFFGSAMTSKKFQAGQGWVQLGRELRFCHDSEDAKEPTSTWQSRI